MSADRQLAPTTATAPAPRRLLPYAERRGRSPAPGAPLILLAIIALAFSAAAIGRNAQASDAPALDLPAAASQGTLVIGRTEPGNKVTLGERSLQTDSSGKFVFGVGRDEAGPLSLSVVRKDGRSAQRTIAIFSREWPTERVTGVPQSTVTPSPAVAERIAREQAKVTAARSIESSGDVIVEQFQWPTRGRVSGVFGSQRIYNGTPKAPHSGLDVAAPQGTPLKSPAAGRVTLAEPDLFLTGGTVLIDHGHGISSVFLHLSRIDVEVGQTLAAGEVFGLVGATGRATGPHMHWGVNWFNVRVDPATLPGIAGD